MIIESILTFKNIYFYFAIHVLDYGENGNEIILFIMLDYQKILLPSK